MLLGLLYMIVIVVLSTIMNIVFLKGYKEFVGPEKAYILIILILFWILTIKELVFYIITYM